MEYINTAEYKGWWWAVVILVRDPDFSLKVEKFLDNSPLLASQNL